MIIQRKLLSLLLLLSTVPSFAKTLTAITVLPPASGYWIFSATNMGTLQLTPRCTYSDSTTDNCTASSVALTWFTDNTADATISSSGLITGTGSNPPIAGQSTQFSAGAYSGTIVGHALINVNYYALTCLLVRPETSTSATLVVGTTALLSAVDCSPASGIGSPTVFGPAVGDFPAWTSSNSSIATVNPTGEVTGIAAGSVTITATLPGITATRTITITAPTTSSSTWYVRPGGGTAWTSRVTSGQCNGTANIDYPGTGTNQNCAFSNPMYCFTDESSTTTYTGVFQSGDTCMVAVSTIPYPVANKSFTTSWVTNVGSAIAPPSGTPAHPSRILGSNYASCSADPYHPGNRTTWNAFGGIVLNLYDVQNLDIECIDIASGQDCNQALASDSLDFNCQFGDGGWAMIFDSFTANLTVTNTRIHGFETSSNGTAGPGLVWTGNGIEFNFLDGINFDNPYGYNGDRTDGFTAEGITVSLNGCTEEQAKPLTGGSVARDGAGNLNVTFPSGSLVNYVPMTNLVLAGMTPSDLNGTFPVTAITANQQTVTITGGSISSYNDGYNSVWGASFTTSSEPAFGVGAFVTITGATPSFLNGSYEVYSVSSSGFVVAASVITRPTWTAASSGETISSGGTASTAITLVASATGSAESATVLGTASHVYPAHRCMDQQDTGYSNGDGVGTGNNTIGAWSLDHGSFHRNTQDGWDMLHSQMTRSTVSNTLSEGNQGAPWKAGDADVANIFNNIGVGTGAANMAFDPNLPPEYNQYLVLFYRANDCFGTHNYAWQSMIVSNNTWECGFNVFQDDTCDSEVGCQAFAGLNTFIWQNNLIAGFTDTNDTGYDESEPTIYYGDGTSALPIWSFQNNVSVGMRNPPGYGSGNNWSVEPGLINRIQNISTFLGEQAALPANYNLNITSTALARGYGIQNAYTPANDQNGFPTTSPPAAGALNFATPTPVSITVTPSPTTITVGNTTTVTATCTYSDGSSSTCTVTWSDTGSHSSIGPTTGIVTGISIGSDIVTATISTINGTGTVNIVAAPPFVPVQGLFFRGIIQ